ncbi:MULTISPECIES: DUF6461 domain-containing protein [unclassified Streptomyces]|uniref:DUF6461 domain-containing protein n=1 Tax=unclassified Streptomyces TaxID=2593676 RepID=UPI002DD908C0|nr:hypothetical protein [Streptomyces sp. NBC_01445]WSE02683.1 DUF6461 domain-containing protein [Streptomyces sp. NBC_01445]
MNDGIGWIAREEIAWTGYCITLARGLEPEELVRRLAGNTAPAPLGDCTGYDLDAQLTQAAPRLMATAAAHRSTRARICRSSSVMAGSPSLRRAARSPQSPRLHAPYVSPPTLIR